MMRTIHWKSHANNLNANKWKCQLWSDSDDGNNILQGLLKPVKIKGGVEATRFVTVDYQPAIALVYTLVQFSNKAHFGHFQ